MKKLILIFAMVILGGCTPEVGSDDWCKQMKEKEKKNWTFEETKNYTKHCIFK